MAYLPAVVYKKPCGLDVRGSQSLDASYLRLRGLRGAAFIAALFSAFFKWTRSGAVSAIYVSNELREQFPLPPNRPVSVFSDIRLPEWWFTEARTYAQHTGAWRISTVGRLEVGKGLKVLIDALACLVHKEKLPVKLELIGSGPLESELRQYVAASGLADQVEFSGYVPWGRELHKKLLLADLFVLTSVSEGMPRVVIEAMACGLPIVSTAVGGARELLVSQDLVPVADVAALTARLQEVLADPAQLVAMSKRNVEFIQAFRPDRLRSGKKAFYERLRRIADSSVSGH
jgi:glycosyltransferase involved in cell wall biosynthesis